jgi:cell division protein FtsL
MRRGEAGAGRFKMLLSLAILASVAYVAVKTIPVYVNNYQLQDHIQQLSTQLAVRAKPATADEVGNEVVTFAQDHGIPLTSDNVKVTISRHVTINLDYTVPVDLTVYILRLHFTPSANSPVL